MNTLVTVISVLGGITGLISIFTTYSKIHELYSTLKSRDEKLESQIKELRMSSEFDSERVELLVNGVKERMEHLNTRLSNEYKETRSVFSDIEGFLQKKTEYERRSR